MKQRIGLPIEVENFLQNKRVNNKSEATINLYEKELKVFLTKTTDKTIEKITINDIINISSNEVNSYKEFLNNKQYKAATINKKLAIISSFQKYLKEKGLINTNVINEVGKVKQEERLPVFLSVDEGKAIINVSLKDIEDKKENSIRNALILNLFLSCGLRNSELRELKFQNVNIETGEINIIGKGNKQRVVYMNKNVLELYKLWLNIRKNMKCLIKENKEYLLLSRKQTPFSSMQINRIVKDFARRAAVKKDITVHKLRHTYATALYNSGMVDIYTLQVLLGHSNIQTTSIYTHVAADKLKDVTNINPIFN